MHVLRYPSFKTLFQTFKYCLIQKHRTKNVKTYIKKNMFKVCGTKSGRYCTNLDAYISKKQKVSCKCKCYRKEIMSSICLLFIYVGLHTDYISAFTC